ncbi:MAG: DNA-protecting protein DprA [Rickettsiales bacterium]|jgi:DNA processing protein|nr:DNA-protecting protein DprA [Rickettsiales bacterium]
MNLAENNRRLIRIFLSKSNSSKALKSLQQSITDGNVSQVENYYSAITESEFEEEYAKLQKLSAEYLTILDPIYPALLKQIYDPPPILIIKGNRDLLARPKIAIIGGRNAGYSYLNFVTEIANFLSSLGFVVVSGLANGIDTYAHIGAGAGNTIAVIASGIDICYPRQNYKLYQEIQNQGLVISESRVGMPPKANLFPRRNRIIVGLSKSVIASNVKIKSGSILTCRLAVENNRELIILPGAPNDIQHSGSNKLIRDGAMIFTNLDDLGSHLCNIYDSCLDISTPLAPRKIIAPKLQNSNFQNIIKMIPADGILIEELSSMSKIICNQLIGMISEMELDDLIYVDSTKRIFLK